MGTSRYRRCGPTKTKKDTHKKIVEHLALTIVSAPIGLSFVEHHIKEDQCDRKESTRERRDRMAVKRPAGQPPTAVYHPVQSVIGTEVKKPWVK